MINETEKVNTNQNEIIVSINSIRSVHTSQFSIGILLAIASSLFIGTSFILKKKSLVKLTAYNGTIRAGSGGFGYLRELQWWIGLATMGFGEFCNFTAYGFAPASVVTPLGALSVLVSALMAARFLGEKLNTLSKIGCLLTVFGAIILIIHAPKDSDIHSVLEFQHKIQTREFILFSIITLFVVICLIVYYGPRLGSKYVYIYILICSLMGAFTITACKGLSVGLKEIYNHENTYSKWLTFSCAIIILFCILVQIIYLNRALDLFSTSLVTTVYYVLFTTCVLITYGILFHEWKKLTFIDILTCLVGFAVTTCGLILINSSKTALQSNDPLFSCFFSSSTINPKQQQQQQHIPVKSYVDLLIDDDDHLSSITNSFNEQRQPMLMIDERDLNS